MLSSWIFVVCLAGCFPFFAEAEYRRDVYLGGIFSEDDYISQMVFEYSIRRMNMHSNNVRFKSAIRTMSEIDSFKTGKIFCNLTAMGVAAIFGPNSIDARGIAQSISRTLEIPHIETFWVSDVPTMNSEINSLNFYPASSMLANGIAALVEDYDWKSCTIFYEDDDGIVRFQEVLKRQDPANRPIKIRKLYFGSDNRSTFKAIQRAGETNIILDCDAEHIVHYLKEANEVDLMGDYQVYILTSLNAHTVDFTELDKIKSNLTSLRMVDPKSDGVRMLLQVWREGERDANSDKMHLIPQAEKFRLEAALMYDAVYHFGSAYLKFNSDDQQITEEQLDCNTKKTWQYGLDLINFAKNAPSEGLSGNVILNDKGERDEFTLDIMELAEGSPTKIGLWHSQDKKIINTRSKDVEEARKNAKMQDKIFRIVSRIGKPFLDHKEPKDGEILVGNDRFEGYSLDLIHEIAQIMKIKYEFYLVEDTKYGAIDPKTGQWNGLVRDILDRKADFAICDLTITYERKTAVDFTMPFMNLGISILYSKGKKEDPALFSFTEPLSMEVWIYMGTAYLGVSLLLFILARVGPGNWDSVQPGDKNPRELVNVWELRNVFWFSWGSLMGAGCDILPKMAPKEWCNPHPCDPEPEELENALTLLNSMWLALGSFLQQGSDILPKAVSTRMVAGMWWFFTLIMISSYTANLAAFLTNDRLEDSITSAEELAKQVKVKYGTVDGGSTSNFFKQSNFSTYKRMWTAMEGARPSVFAKDNDEGVERVKNGRKEYAFLMESTSIEYRIERDCGLTKIGGLLDSKGYGIAMPMNSPYRPAINEALLKLQEKGKLVVLKNKWWKEMHGGGACDTSSGETDAAAAELGIKNIGGVFLVLGCGCGIAAFIAALEFLWNVREVAVTEKITMKDALIAELKFALNVWETTKPVHPPSESNSTHSSRSRSGSNSSKREASPARSTAGNMLHAASSFMRLDKVF